MRNRGLAATGAAAGLSGLVLLLAACGGNSGNGMNAGSAYGGSSMSASPTASAMMGGGSTNGMGTTATTATLTMATTKIGKVMTDAKGDTLYVYSKDMRGGPSTCTMSCAKEWPAVKGKPVAAMGVKFAGGLGSVKDTDGTIHATYDGYPLYTYAGDMAPGDTAGNGAGGVWHVITGSLLVASSSSGGMMASPKPSSSMGMGGSSNGMGSSGGSGMGSSGGSGMGSSGGSGMGSSGGGSGSGYGTGTRIGSGSGAGTTSVH